MKIFTNSVCVLMKQDVVRILNSYKVICSKVNELNIDISGHFENLKVCSPSQKNKLRSNRELIKKNNQK